MGLRSGKKMQLRAGACLTPGNADPFRVGGRLLFLDVSLRQLRVAAPARETCDQPPTHPQKNRGV